MKLREPWRGGPANPDVHGTFRPSDVRQGEPISCRVGSLLADHFSPFDVWRISPFGIELVEDDRCVWEVGEQISLVLTVVGQTMTYRGTIVAKGQRDGAKILFGVRLETSPKAERLNKEIDQREGRPRWQCHRLFYPTGVANNRARFNDKIFFRVTDISSDGLRLVTSMRNKHLVVGTQLELKMQVPSIGDFSVKVRIAHASVTQEEGIEHQKLGVKLMRPSRRCLSHLGQYVLQFGGDDKLHPTPKALAQQGFFLQSIADALEYDVVRSDDEYQQVLKLRSTVFRSVEGFGVKMSPEEFADVYDARSRILICRYRGKVVATARLLFLNAGECFEEEQYLTLPDNFPPRHLVVGAARAAIHPEFRGNDLFLNVFRYGLLQTLQAGRRYIMQSVVKELIPIYERVGFRRMNLTYHHPKFPGKEGHLLLGDCQRLLDGQVGSPLTWNTLVPQIRELLRTNDNIHLSWLARKRLAAYQMLTPLYRAYEKKKVELRMRKRFGDGGL